MNYDTQDRNLISADAIAKRFSVSKTTIYRLAARGEIPSYNILGRVRFREEDVSAYLTRHRRGSDSSSAGYAA